MTPDVALDQRTVEEIVGLLRTDSFRRALHDWYRARRNLDRSGTDNVTDLLGEIAERLEGLA